MADNLNRPWLDLDAVFIPRKLHKVLKNPEKWLPRFDPDDRNPTKDHIKSYM